MTTEKNEIIRLSWTPLTEVQMAVYEEYREAVAAAEPFNASSTLSWLLRDNAPTDDFFLVGTTAGRIIADLEFYQDGYEGTLRFDIRTDQANIGAYKALLSVGLDRIPVSTQTVTTSSAQSLEGKCAAIIESGFQPDSRTMLLSAAIDKFRVSDTPDLSGITILPLRLGQDIPELTKLHNAVFALAPGARPIALAEMRDMVTENLKAGQSILLASIGSVPVGWVWSGLETECGSRQLFVESIGVSLEHCRRGIGSSLLAAALAGVRNTNVTRIMASVDDRNDVSRSFFEQLGLRPAESTNWYIRRLAL